MDVETDVVIIGSGIAALQAARFLSSAYDVHIVTKSDIRNGSSFKAQGGIAAVNSTDDHVHLHYQDTLKAGEYHHSEENLKTLVEIGKDTVNQLIHEHFPVDRNEYGNIALGLEGAHSKPRIVHSGGDATGKALVTHLLKQIPDNVTIHEYEIAYTLLQNTSGECIGVKTKTDDGNNTYLASYVILATGGAGALYACTSNCENSYGDGIALAYLAGAKITDMEFIQFHPSLLYVNGKAQGLISEAVRGAGGFFVNQNGRRIMKGVHPLEDLAPRHVTAYEIYKERAKGNEVYIDISHIEHFQHRFPTITNLCVKNGIDLSKGLIPIAPGSHFLMGGIVADSFGRTSIPRLFAVGETACTGVHGANRLASNSLLEGITFGKLMAQYILRNGTVQTNFKTTKRNQKPLNFPLLPKEELQKEMLDKAGIVRSGDSLKKLLKLLPNYNDVFDYNLEDLSRKEVERFFMHIVASLITNAAMMRKESRGAHIRLDYPNPSSEWQQQWIIFENGEMIVGNLNEFA